MDAPLSSLFRCLPLKVSLCYLALLTLATASELVGKLLVDVIPGEFNTIRGYLSVKEVNYTYKVVPHAHLCVDYARAVGEPYSPAYWRRSTLDELNDGLPLAYWNWNGNITSEVYQMAARSPHAVKYKIIGGKLYRDIVLPTGLATQMPRVNGTEHLLKFALYLYPLPDMEFLVHFGDGDFPGHPFFTYTQTRNATNTGFAMPSFGVWQSSLGITQLTAYHACLRERYPANRRKPMAVWRGSSTGHCPHPDMEHCMEMLRIRLHMLSRQHPDLMDTRLVNLVQECGRILGPLLNDTAPAMHMEEANNYCVVLDADGNGWSDRFIATLVHFPTVVMKEATNKTAYIEHMYAPGVHIEQYDSGLTTLVDRVRRVVADCQRGEQSPGQAMVHRMQDTSRMMLNHVAMARAMAYGLATYQRLSAWEMNRSLEGMRRINEPCCGRVTLPPEVLDDLNRQLALP